MQLNEKLAMLRKNSGYSTRELGDKLNVSQSSVSLWEKGVRRPDYQNIIKLSEIYGVSTDYLLGSNNQNDKTPINALNETRNMYMSNLHRLEDENLELTNKIFTLNKQISYDQEYLSHINQNALEKPDNQLINLLIKKIQTSESQLHNLHKEKTNNLNAINSIKQKLFKLDLQFQIEKDKEKHLYANLGYLKEKKFNEIKIDSEYELQVIILKYLGIYDSFINKNITINELIEQIKYNLRKSL